MLIKNSKIEMDSVGYCVLHSFALDKDKIVKKNCCMRQCPHLIRLNNGFWETEDGIKLSRYVDYFHNKENYDKVYRKRMKK